MESLGLREDGQHVLTAKELASAPPEWWAQVYPCGVDRRAVLGEPVPPAGSSAGLKPDRSTGVALWNRRRCLTSSPPCSGQRRDRGHWLF